MGRAHISVDDNTKIQLHIHVLGYYPQGESILTVAWDEKNNEVLHSMLIDFFEINDDNKVISILNQYHINESKLDHIVWTHPDKDHSVGLSRIIKNYTSDKTIYLIPDGFTRYYKAFFNTSVLLSWLSMISNKWRKRLANIERVNYSPRRLTPMIYAPCSFEDGYHDKVEYEVEILTPIAGLVMNQMESNKTHKTNNISISFIIKFGGQSFYFGGDVENPAINKVSEEHFHNIVFVKIPHHGSKTSSALPKILSNLKTENLVNQVNAISTSFAKGDILLPENDILNEYKKCSSSILLTENKEHSHNYGVWFCGYNIKPYMELEPKPTGDASIWFKN